MSEAEKTRLWAWGDELRRVHARLRRALMVTREAVASGTSAPTASRDLLLFCHGFCGALTEHHVGEDRELFPAIVADHPELRETLWKLEQDHSMIAHLVTALQTAVDAQASPDDLARHLEGISAIMESHFRFEERQLLTVLDALALALDADPSRVLGSL